MKAKKLFKILTVLFVVPSLLLACSGQPTAETIEVTQIVEVTRVVEVTPTSGVIVQSLTQIPTVVFTATPNTPTPCAFNTHNLKKGDVLSNGMELVDGTEVTTAQVFGDFEFTIQSGETIGAFLAQADGESLRPVYVLNSSNKPLTTTVNALFIDLQKAAPGLATGPEKKTPYTGTNLMASSIAAAQCGSTAISDTKHGLTTMLALGLKLELLKPWKFVFNGVFELKASPPVNE